MKLHRMRVSAFGPFPGTVEVDFDTLGMDGLFLLHGDTGAGKTSLLDAVSFALFGTVPGARQEAHRLRSDLAANHDRTEVELELTIGGYRMRLTRSPEYLRPKSRGDGTTKSIAKASLVFLGNPPPGSAPGGYTRLRDVGDKVLELLGMSAEQFFQVVLLPQGDFARFLRSGTSDRERLLERLFDTRRFGQVEDWFAEARRVSGAQVRAVAARIREQLARVAESAAADLEIGPEVITAAGGLPGPLFSSLADLRDRQSDRAQCAAIAADSARQGSARAAVALTTAKQQAELVGRYVRLRHQEQDYLLAKPQRESWQQALAAAERAVPLIRVHTRVEAARADLDQAELQLTTARAGLSSIIQRSDTFVFSAEQRWFVDPDLIDTAAAARAAQGAAQLRAGGLEPLLAEADLQLAEEAELDEMSQQASAFEVRLAELTGQLELIPDRLQLLREEAQDLHVRAAGLEVEQDRLAQATRLRELAEGEPALVKAHLQAVDRAQRAIDEAQRATDRRQQLTSARITGMAAELAEKLVAGVACSVCGCPEHPHPAEPALHVITAEDVAEAEQAEQQSMALRERASNERGEAELKLRALVDILAGRTLAQLVSDCENLSRAVQGAEAAARRVVDVELDLGQTLITQQTLSDQLDLVTAKLRAIRTGEDNLKRSIALRGERLDANRGGYPTIRAHRDHQIALAQSLGALADELATVAYRAEIYTRAVGEAEVALGESGFASFAEAIAATELDRMSVAKQLRQAQDLGAAIAAQIADPVFESVMISLDGEQVSLVQVPQTSLLDVRDQCDQLYAQTQRAWSQADDAAQDSWALAQAEAGRLARLNENLRQLFTEIDEAAPIITRDQQLIALTEVIQGKGANRLSMSLRTYVLASRLKEVAVAANQRLSVMSEGRYSFIPSVLPESRAKTSGLGLDILDTHTGLPRSAKTLSGGETFLASLALALGLADVVAAESGARVLDTLFIDEGFGSLDADTLDLVMATLDDLRAGGRVVGLVSHVDELRHRIPNRLLVRKSTAGSSLHMAIN